MGFDMKIRRTLLLVAALVASSVALAQNVLQPYLQGSSTEHRRDIVEVGMLRLPQQNNGLTALAGGAQAGTALNLGFNRFTTVATGGDSAQLPVVGGAVMIVVVNATANSMNIFPPTGGTINALSANSAFALAAGKSVIFYQAVDGGTWYANLSA
jgi:hypothetical protein